MAEAQPPFSDAAGCRAWLAHRTLSNPQQCHAPLSAQLRSLPGAAIAPMAKLEILELLRDPVAQAQLALARECRGAPIPLDPNSAEADEKYERALLMPEDATRKIPASIFRMPGWHRPGRVLALHGDKERWIKLQALLEQGSNYERAMYAG